MNIILVGIGGFFGAISRFLLSTWLTRLFAPSIFPYGTFTANMLGCLLIGILAALIQKLQVLPIHLQFLLITGFLGGFTTFSSYALENLQLLQSQHYFAVLINIVVQTALGVGLAGLGYGLALSLVNTP